MTNELPDSSTNFKEEKTAFDYNRQIPIFQFNVLILLYSLTSLKDGIINLSIDYLLHGIT